MHVDEISLSCSATTCGIFITGSVCSLFTSGMDRQNFLKAFAKHTASKTMQKGSIAQNEQFLIGVIEAMS